MAKVQVLPQNEIVKIEKENKPVVRKAEALTIKVSDDETAAYDILKAIKERTTVIEKRRKAITQPLNTSLKATNALFKELSGPLKEADGIIRNKILEFREKREEVARKRQERLEVKAEEAEEAGDDERAEELAERAENVEAKVGDSVTAKRWTFEVIDIKEVPLMYLQLDSVAIRLAIRNGERKIAGLNIYQESSVRVC